MNDNKKIKHLSMMWPTIGELPSSYLMSMTYEEQLIYLCKKIEEVIGWANEELTDQIKEYIETNFNDILIDSMYDSETETLILYIDRSDE